MKSTICTYYYEISLSWADYSQNLGWYFKGKAAPNWFCVSRDPLKKKELTKNTFYRILFFFSKIGRKPSQPLTGNTESIWRSLMRDWWSLFWKNWCYGLGPISLLCCFFWLWLFNDKESLTTEYITGPSVPRFIIRLNKQNLAEGLKTLKMQGQKYIVH